MKRETLTRRHTQARAHSYSNAVLFSFLCYTIGNEAFQEKHTEKPCCSSENQPHEQGQALFQIKIGTKHLYLSGKEQSCFAECFIGI